MGLVIRKDYVDPEPARLHIEMLVTEHSFTLSNIARVAQTSVAQLWYIRMRKRKFITESLDTRIRNVRPEDKELKVVPEYDHGTMQSYRQGCHCDECRAENTRVSAEYIQKVKAGILGKNGPADPARKHVKWLMAEGVLVPHIAAQAGRAVSTIRSLLDEREGHTQQTIRPDLESDLLGVKLENCVRGRYVPSGEIMVLIYDLNLRQWSLTDISTGSGLNSATARKALTNGLMDRSTAEAITRFFVLHMVDEGPSAKAVDYPGRMGFLPAWRVDPALVSRLTPDENEAEEELEALDEMLGLTIAAWLQGCMDTGAWAALPVAARAVVLERFGLGNEVSTGLAPEYARGLVRLILEQLLRDPGVPVAGYDNMLRLYMTHPGLRRLAG